MGFLSVAWAVLNIGFLLVLLRFWIKGFTLIAAQYGRWSTGAVFLLTLSMCARPAPTGQVTRQAIFHTCSGQNASFNTPIGYASPVTLLNLPLTTISGYCTSANQPPDSLHITFQTIQTGLMGYLRWESQAESISRAPDHRLHYQSEGILTWYLLGIPFYQQRQQFSGDITLQPEPHRPRA